MNRARKLYRRLLRLYPAEFRGEFASQMERQFNQEFRAAEGEGSHRHYVLRAILDVLVTAPVELLRELREDLRHALRIYRKSPGATAIIIVVLAVGMAFVVAFLSLYADLLLRPDRGFESGAPVVSVSWYDGRNTGRLPRDLVEQTSSEASTLEHVAGSAQLVFYVDGGNYTLGDLVTRDFFPGLRPKLALGRGFSEAEHDEHGEPVVVISWRYWQTEFGGRPDVLDQIMYIEVPTFGVQPPGASAAAEKPPSAFRIIGVLDRTFTGLAPATELSTRSSFWIPGDRALSLYPESLRSQIAAGGSWRVVARRAVGVSNIAVTNELEQKFALSGFVQRAGAAYDVSDGLVTDIRVRLETRRQLELFLGASVLLALVAAANVSLFLLARAPGRRRELAIRMAMGASIGRLTRQLLSESAVLVAVAAALGLALSLWVAKWLPTLPILREAQWTDVTLLDWHVLVLVTLFLVLATLLISLAPIMATRRMSIEANSRQVAARATPGQYIACASQIMVASVMSGAAIAFVWYYAELLLTYPGYIIQDRYAVPYVLSSQEVDPLRVREAFLAVPGITAVSQAMSLPGMVSPTAGDGLTMVASPGNPEEAIAVRIVPTDTQFAALIGMRLLHGRNVVDSDSGGALVNQAFAREYFGREDVAGEPVPEDVSQAAGFYVNEVPTLIIGVLGDVPFGHPLAGAEPMIFPSGTSRYGGYVLFESTLPLATLRQQIQDAAKRIELTVITDNTVPLAGARQNVLAPDRARGYLTIGAATLVMLLAAFGVYGTQRYLVLAGRREYAIRASVGATPAALGRLVLIHGLRLAIPGTLLALPLCVMMVGWLREHYIPRSVPPYAVALIAGAVLLILTLLASIGPAAIARRTLPAQLLREA